MVTCYTSHAEISDFALPSRSLEDALQIAAQPSSSNAHQHGAFEACRRDQPAVNVIYGDRKQTQLRVYPHILLHLCCDLSGGISQLSHAGLAQYPFHACFFLPATEDIDNIADQLRREHVHGVGKFSIARPRHYLDVTAQALSGCNGMVFSCRKDLN